MEIYNPATGTFATTVSHTANFSYQTMTLLNNGKVLVAGGYDSCLNGCATPYLNSAELFDPVSRVFSPTGSLSVVRAFATAVLLNDGSVLVVGGGNAAGQAGTAEVYDASSGVFTAAGAMETTRSGNTATLLTDGTVLIVGGAGPLASAELYESTPLVPSSLQVTPTAVTMQVGNTRQFTAVDNHGNPRPDATWAVSDTSLATITPDSPPTLTAVAPGQVTVTATAEGVTAQAQVTIIDQGITVPGTALWSVPSVPGFTPLQISQAVPTDNGAPLPLQREDSERIRLVERDVQLAVHAGSACFHVRYVEKGERISHPGNRSPVRRARKNVRRRTQQYRPLRKPPTLHPSFLGVRAPG